MHSKGHVTSLTIGAPEKDKIVFDNKMHVDNFFILYISQKLNDAPH